jgi:hypothetical protein
MVLQFARKFSWSNTNFIPYMAWFEVSYLRWW